MDKERTIIIKEKSADSASNLAKFALTTMALFTVGPVLGIGLILAIIFVGCVCLYALSGQAHAGIWLLATLLVISLVPALRERISGQLASKKLQQHVQQLELELSETKLQLAELQEGHDFHLQLKEDIPKGSAFKGSQAG
jgi:hypothetical protein